jgi:hypothetical protein
MFDNDTELLVAIFQKVFRLMEKFDERDEDGEIVGRQHLSDRMG